MRKKRNRTTEEQPKAVGTLSPPFPDEQLVLPPVRLEVNDLARLEDPGEVVDLEGDVVGIDVGNAVADARIVPRVAVPCVHPARTSTEAPIRNPAQSNSHSDQLICRSIYKTFLLFAYLLLLISSLFNIASTPVVSRPTRIKTKPR
jgi:hypothetical protein